MKKKAGSKLVMENISKKQVNIKTTIDELNQMQKKL